MVGWGPLQRMGYGFGLHCHSECACEQFEEHFDGDSQAQGRGIHGGFGIGEVLPALRHDLYRGAEATHRDLLDLRQEKTAQAVQARRGRHPQPIDSHGHRPEEDGKQPAQHRRDGHRSEHLPKTPVLPHRKTLPGSLLPLLLQQPHGHVRTLPRTRKDSQDRPRPIPRQGEIHPRRRNPPYPLQSRKLPLERTRQIQDRGPRQENKGLQPRGTQPPPLFRTLPCKRIKGSSILQPQLRRPRAQTRKLHGPERRRRSRRRREKRLQPLLQI